MSALTYTQLANEVKNIISGTSGIGPIYTVPNDFRTQEEMETKCVAGVPPRINVWFIDRTNVRNSLTIDSRPVALGTGARIHDFLLEGWYGYIQDSDENTHLTFQNIITSMLDTVQGKKQRSSTSESPFITDTDEFSVSIDKREFMGGVICHHALINIAFQEFYVVNYI